MGRDDWSASAAWDAEAQADFNIRIRRARKGHGRPQHFRTKARCLFRGTGVTNETRLAAVELLKRALTEAEPDPRWETMLLLELGKFQLMLGDLAAGQASLARCADTAEARAGWCQQQQWLLARCQADADDFAGAIRAFDALYEQDERKGTSPRPRYEPLEALPVADARGELYTDPEQAAEMIVVYHHAGDGDEPAVPEVSGSDREAVLALDRLFRTQDSELARPYAPRVFYQREFLERHLILELGAFLGRVPVNTASARWQIESPLMRSRLVLADRVVNPFRASFAAAFYEVPLPVLLDKMLGVGAAFELP